VCLSLYPPGRAAFGNLGCRWGFAGQNVRLFETFTRLACSLVMGFFDRGTMGMRRWRGFRGLVSVIVVLCLISVKAVNACTIFVLTDATRTLFFNNEDFSNPTTRIWFEPAGSNYFACAFVGFDNGWAQGGLNSEGLAFDWVAGEERPYAAEKNLKPARGNPAARLLESCRNVDEAIAFYQKVLEPSFNRASVLIADKSGASVIVGARDGKIHFDRSTKSRGFGYGNAKVQAALREPPAPTVTAGLKLLRECKQEGMYGTKYSTVFDLRNGDITVSVPERPDVALNFQTELKKGRHYYEIPSISEQVTQPLKPLAVNMLRFPMDHFVPIKSMHPERRTQVEQMLKDVRSGSPNREHYSDAVWNQVSGRISNIQEDMQVFGKLLTVEAVTQTGTPPAGTADSSLYRFTFENVKILQKYEFAGNNRVKAVETYVFEKSDP
jgi:hypothetical protein